MSQVNNGQVNDTALQYRRVAGTATGFRGLIKNFRVFAITCFACIGGLLYGYNQGVFSGILTMPSFAAHMGDYVTNSIKKGWLTSILELGAWIRAIYSGFLAEAFSRKYAIILSTSIFIIGVVIQATAIRVGPQAILGSRFVTGMGIGSLSVVVPIYVAECAPPESRGLLLGVQQFAIEFGVMISFWLVRLRYSLHWRYWPFTRREAAWLVPLTLQLGPALVLLVGMIFMPLTPRWLVHHNRETEARQVLAQLRSSKLDGHVVELEFLEIKSQSLFEKRTVEEQFPLLTKISWSNTLKLQFVAIGSLFRTEAMFKRVVVATVTMFFSQWRASMQFCIMPQMSIFGALGMSSNTTSLLATGVIGIVMLVATIPTLIWIDKIGRKPILTLGALGMAFCHLAIAVIFARNESNWASQQASAWACVVLVWVYVAFFGWSWGPCEWILVAEIWPLSARPYGVAIATSTNWMNNFIVGQVTPDLIANIRYGTFIIFGILIAVDGGFIFFFTPETSKLTLEEMDLVFGSSGVAAADNERMLTINREIGLDQTVNELLRRASVAEKETSVEEREHAEPVEVK
ncbi:hypothetical protein N7462_003247 [Penicillium macrosclerotiorum]|uniref:uncharacterized protein n=1 Tax=Penicillium macrosclerotiorum TaxID=303699 RepID=UPI002548CD1E|nr:uncharacterized protein N7462_003247 [Penicillium macrosclerotiorum]KAJ5688855.1 hypothetical protein N7462_003247 [Penicillium macrosclerotiorum]